MILFDIDNLLMLIGICIAIGIISIIMLAVVINQLKNVLHPSSAQNTSVASAYISDNDEELVAVIAAAIAASLGTSSDKLVIKSIRRTENNSPAWNAASRQRLMDKCL